MNRLLIVLSLLGLLLVAACETNNDSDDEIIFGGITKTNAVGVILTQDSTDWSFTDDWNTIENSLFPDLTLSVCHNQTQNYSIIACPNPCVNRFLVHINLSGEIRFAYCLVDRYYNILAYSDSIYSSDFYINVDEFNIVNDTIRMYYILFENDCELTGHGDILKIE